jgi:uncharacterized protein (TIGR02246 family)
VQKRTDIAPSAAHIGFTSFDQALANLAPLVQGGGSGKHDSLVFACTRKGGSVVYPRIGKQFRILNSEARMKIIALLATSIALLAVVVPQTSYAEDSTKESTCPKDLHQRTVAQVLNAHIAAFQSGNSELLACDYANDAVFVLPGTIARGRASIQAAFAAFFALAGGNIQVTTNSATLADDIALLEYAVTSSHITVSDGVDSFVVDDGLIVAQTAHLGGLVIK